jgi:uncharacterized protein YggT (Ycf19 family)
MESGFSAGILLIDYALGVAMWTLIGRFGMSIFLPDNSDFFFMRVFVRATDPMIHVMARLTPAFLIERLKPLYVAWFLYMIRFYLMPLVLGYDVMGMLSFPLESDAAIIIYDLGKIFR